MGFIDTTDVRRFDGAKLQKINLFETAQMFCDVYCLEPGQEQKLHSHAGATKFYYVIEGEAEITIGDRTETVGPGALAHSAPGEAHAVANRSAERLVLLVSMAPNPNAE